MLLLLVLILSFVCLPLRSAFRPAGLASSIFTIEDNQNDLLVGRFSAGCRDRH